MTKHIAKIASGDDEVDGVWRDGSRLVVSRFECTYPRRCVKTNTDDDVVMIDFDSAKIGNAALVTGVMAASAVASAAAGERGVGRAVEAIDALTQKPAAMVSIPLSQKWLVRRKRSKLFSQLCLVVGVLGTLGCTGGFVMLMSKDFDTPGSTAVLWGFLGMLILTATGLISLLFTNQEPLQLNQQTDHRFWLKGASKKYLEALPELTMESMN